MEAHCISIESNVDFAETITSHDTIAFCYPIYCSRVPRIMREFVTKHMEHLKGKKIIIFVTQWLFSGDGARVFTDMFEENYIEVIYAQHFNFPNNIGNLPFSKIASPEKIQKYMRKSNIKMNKACKDIKNGVVVHHGFGILSQSLGKIQGLPWQGNSKSDSINRSKFYLEERTKSNVKIHPECIACNVCIFICPMDNLENNQGKIQPLNNCTGCYRCVNRCPKKAITVMLHRRPKWQYSNLKSKD